MQVVQFANYVGVFQSAVVGKTSFGNFRFGRVYIPVIPLNRFFNVASLHKIIYCTLCFENGYHECVYSIFQVIINTHLDCLVYMLINVHVSTTTFWIGKKFIRHKGLSGSI